MKHKASELIISVALALGAFAACAAVTSYQDPVAGPGASFAAQTPGSTKLWSQTSSLPEPLETQAAAVNNGFLYVMGGLSNGTPTSSVLYAKINSDGTLKPFQETTPLPYTLYRYLCGVVNNGFIYAIGGIANGYTTSSVVYAPILSDGTVGDWLYTTSLPEPLQLQGTVANKGYLYVMGGSTA